MLIYTNQTCKRKKRKPDAKARALKASWEDILKKYDVKTSKPTTVIRNHPVTIIRDGSDTRHIPSRDSGQGIAVKKEHQHYTGDAMIGIGQLHKSNAIPVFKQEDAIDISKMRRG
jgi:hypothetical protein